MIAIVDYGVGNLFSLQSSLKYIGGDVTVTGDALEPEPTGPTWGLDAEVREESGIFLGGGERSLLQKREASGAGRR